MRTTVTIEPDVASKIKALAHRRQATFKATLNDVLRRGLAAQHEKVSRRFVVRPHSGRFAPGIDLGKLNQLVDDLDVQDFLGEARQR